MANNLYMRAVPLRRRGLDIEIIIHPQDNYVMSHPAWEEFDGELDELPTDIRELRCRGVALPEVSKVWQEPPDGPFVVPPFQAVSSFMSRRNYNRFAEFLRYIKSVERIRSADAALAVQVPYLALFANRPYVATQMGGEIWYEAARGDLLGYMQRRAYRSANAFLISNPWSFAHARRYNLVNLALLPFMLDEEVYAPGPSEFRDEWQKRTGGTFFVLSTARLDDMYKGSDVGLQGFARFARQCPGARLVVLGWGKDKDARIAELAKFGVSDRVLVLPIAGKRRLGRYLRAADCLLDQFVLGYYGATGLEAMACGVPIIMRLNVAQYDAICETGAPPVLNASTGEKVAQHLSYLAQHPGERARLAAAHRAWFLANHGSSRWAPDYVNILVSTALGHRFSYRDSPLANPLTRIEREYHAEQLANAPPFPNYD